MPVQKVRLILLAVCWAGVVTFGIYVAEPVSSQDDRPNVLIIVTDDQRERDEMGVMPKTLRIFGEEGTRFTHAFASTPQCCPSRASIFTGRYAHNHGVRRNQDGLQMNQMVTTQRYVQQRAGYKTALVGRYLNAWPVAEDPPFFDKWALFNAGYWNNGFNIDGELTEIEQYATDFIGDQSIEFLREFEEEDDAQPWLMYVTVTAPHFPFYASGEYEDAEVPVWESNPSLEEDNIGDKAGFVAKVGYDPANGEDIYNRRLRTLMSADDMVEEIFDALGEMGEDQDTLAIFVSDNGFLLGEHGLYAKRLPYTESIHVPFYVRWPGRVDAGVTDDRLVSNIDIAPTILDVAGIKTPDRMDGKSFLPILQGKKIPWRDAAFYEYYWERNFPHTPTTHGVRTDRYKYIHYHGVWDIDELYDLKNDPEEMKNLIDSPEHQKLVKQLNKRMFDWLEKTDGMLIPLRRDSGGRAVDRNPDKIRK